MNYVYFCSKYLLGDVVSNTDFYYFLLINIYIDKIIGLILEEKKVKLRELRWVFRDQRASDWAETCPNPIGWWLHEKWGTFDFQASIARWCAYIIMI